MARGTMSTPAAVALKLIQNAIDIVVSLPIAAAVADFPAIIPRCRSSDETVLVAKFINNKMAKEDDDHATTPRQERRSVMTSNTNNNGTDNNDNERC